MISNRKHKKRNLFTTTKSCTLYRKQIYAFSRNPPRQKNKQKKQINKVTPSTTVPLPDYYLKTTILFFHTFCDFDFSTFCSKVCFISDYLYLCNNRTRLHPIRTARESFFYSNMNQKPRTIQEQLSRLKEKGMVFNDEQKATSFLARISYFRLKYYWIDMLNANDHFVNGANFNAVIDRYEFDKKLRNILFGAIEILEVGLRTKFITTLSLATNSGLWYLDNSLFDNQQFHTNLVLDMKC